MKQSMNNDVTKTRIVTLLKGEHEKSMNNDVAKTRIVTLLKGEHETKHEQRCC